MQKEYLVLLCLSICVALRRDGHYHLHYRWGEIMGGEGEGEERETGGDGAIIPLFEASCFGRTVAEHHKKID